MEFETTLFHLSSKRQAFCLTESGSIYFALYPAVKFTNEPHVLQKNPEDFLVCSKHVGLMFVHYYCHNYINT